MQPVTSCKFFSLEVSLEQDKESSNGGAAQPRIERTFNSQLSLKSSCDENGSGSDSRRGSMTSLNSVDGPSRTADNNKKSKLGLPRVLRKHSKDDDGERTSSKFEKSPRLVRKTTSGQSTSSNSKDNVSTEGSEQDIDAIFKDYEQSEQSKSKSPEQNEFTGLFTFGSKMMFFFLILSTSIRRHISCRLL